MGNAWTTANIPSSVSGKTIIVTGANSGTGYYTALGLGQSGANVILACRSTERGEAALKSLRGAVPNGNFELKKLDLSDLSDVRRFADEFLKEEKPLDVIVNNAGIMKPPYSKSVDGFESQMAANHLGHFALVGLLLPALQKSSQPRVVAVSSLAAWRGSKTVSPQNKDEIVIDFTKNDGKDYNADIIYAETKLANLLFMKELARRHPGIMSVAAHPGITASNLWQHTPKQDMLKKIMQSSENGALPLLRAATEAHGNLKSGESYFAPRGFGWAGAPVSGWFPPLAKDEQFCKAYWAASEAATGVKY